MTSMGAGVRNCRSLVAPLLGMTFGLLTASPALGQTAPGELHIRRLLATPVGALPPMSMPMPASRDHNYWGLRLQSGYNRRHDAPDIRAVAAGIDLQWGGGSVFGITGGYQLSDCPQNEPDCGDNALFGARARLNIITGGPTVATLIGDYSATTTLGTEVGIGYAPGVRSLRNACTVDVGVPISVAMLQSVRLVSFFAPGVAWDVGCFEPSSPTGTSYLVGAGIGVQQLVHRAFDVNLGLQRIFRSGAGLQLGISFSYVRLP